MISNCRIAEIQSVSQSTHFEVNVQHRLPVALAVDAGVVHDDVDAAEGVHAKVEGLLDVVGRRDVDPAIRDVVFAVSSPQILGSLFPCLTDRNRYFEGGIYKFIFYKCCRVFAFQLMSAMTHLAPLSSSPSATALPMPMADPVTMQHFPPKSIPIHIRNMRRFV